MEITIDFRPIDIETDKGGIPSGYDLVLVEKSDYERGGDYDAERLANDKEFYGRHGVMGCNNLHVSEEEFDIFESYQDYQHSLKRIALAKLTEEDKRVLGLID